MVFIGIVIMTPAMSLSDATTRDRAGRDLRPVLHGPHPLIPQVRPSVHQQRADVLADAGDGTSALLPWLFIDRAAWTPATGGLLLLLGVVFTAVPHTLFSASFKHLFAAKTVGIIATLLPFYAAFFGYLIHDETLSLRTIVGGSIILAAIAFETVRSVRM